MEIRAMKANKDRRACRGRRVKLEVRACRVKMEIRAMKANKDRRARRGCRVQMEFRAMKDRRVRLDWWQATVSG